MGLLPATFLQAGSQGGQKSGQAGGAPDWPKQVSLTVRAQ
jgi:hypothetical protein